MGNLKDIQTKEILKDVYGKYIHGDSLTLGQIELKEGSFVPLHHHPHEQITFILDGSLEMQIGEEKIILGNGDFFVIPSGTSHSAKALADTIAIDVFHPVREDYR